MRAGYFPLVVRREQKRKYMLVLSEADNGDIEPFLRFNDSQLGDTLQKVIADLEKLVL